MSEPTPGPYIARGDCVIPAAHKDRAIGGSGNPVLDGDRYAKTVAMTAPCRMPTGEDKANARLMAASWEMREALEQIDKFRMVDGDISVHLHAYREMGRIAARVLAKVRSET